MAVAKDTTNGIVYLGGQFSYIGPYEPFGTQIDSATGIPDFTNAKPNSLVQATCSDGNGGWYIGGDFTKVGDSIRKHIAHIDFGWI